MFEYKFGYLCNIDRLKTEILSEIEITSELGRIDSFNSPEQTIVCFKTELTPEERILLNSILSRHLKLRNVENKEVDSDGAQIVRTKAARRGWTFLAVPIEFGTATIDSLFANKADATPRTGVTLKFYDVQDVEVTESSNEGSIVKTVIDFEPDFNYEVIGGNLNIIQDSGNLQDIHLWIVAVPDLSEIYGGSKEMVGGINLKFLYPNNDFELDGRASKHLTYDSNLHTNKLRFILTHPAGLKRDVQIIIDLFRQ